MGEGKSVNEISEGVELAESSEREMKNDWVKRLKDKNIIKYLS